VKAITENLVAAAHTTAYLGNHKDIDGAKELLQHAYVRTLNSNSERLVSMLRYEYVAVKVLRVLFLESALLFFVAVFGPWRRRLLQALLGPRPNFDAARFWRAAGQLCLLLALPLLFIMLWSAQSKRYYKKIVHSYLVLANENDVIMSNEPTPNPAPSVAPSVDSSVASYRDLKLIPGLQADSGNLMDISNGDGINNYEFSGVVSLAGRLLVVDNETAKLVKPLNDRPDATEMALFEAGVESGSKGVKLNRAWPGIFADWAAREQRDNKPAGKSSYDDIEGLAIRDDGSSGKVLYMMGSHSLDSERRLRKERQVLMRIRLGAMGRPRRAFPGGSDSSIYPDIYRRLVPSLIHDADIHRGQLGLSVISAPVKDGDSAKNTLKDLNIEGLSILPGTHDLLLGLRGPLDNKRAALILRLRDPDKLFGSPTPDADFEVYARLDLGGRGIASLDYDATTGTFYIAAAPGNEGDPDDYSSLWYWRNWREDSVNVQRPTEMMRFQGHKLEGIALLDEQSPLKGKLALVFDEEVSHPSDDLDVRQFGRIIVIDKP
jgi:hypothetical protein